MAVSPFAAASRRGHRRATSKTLTIHSLPLGRVFSGDHQLIIPDYQRPYLWSTDQSLHLIDSLEYAIAAEDLCFLGWMMLVQKSSSELEIMDGQQRLTTLTILWAVLRDLSSGKEADDWNDLIVRSRHELSGHESWPRIAIHRPNRQFFAEYVQEPGNILDLITLPDHAVETESQRAIRDNAAVLYDQIEDWSCARRKELFTLLNQPAYLAVRVAADRVSAYRIFAAMDVRGLEFAPAVSFSADWQPIRKWLQRLARLPYRDWRSVAVWAIENHSDAPVFIDELFRRLERLCAWLLLLGNNPGLRATRFGRLRKELREGAGLDAPSFGLNDEEKRLGRGRLDGELYRMPDIARYVLLRLEELLGGDPEPRRPDAISIEFVLPPNPLPDNGWVRDFTPEQRHSWVYRLGNLLLLDRRPRHGVDRVDFAGMKSEYATAGAGFALTTQAFGYREWTPDLVEARHQALIDLLVTEWKLR
ncbi:DUF262 domain-containing protein [Nocardia cyriacigeorgica]|uniref:DUF262 domain-containing protein n=1 Tax=Nocardia cyriacigeorgica TaxID=135487 RepID=A0A5R8NR93_9NOCA|nr:DUF262 domain-containing HNH endonuclease family protein [Nocardia cyriacigeorgica]TLF78209.1 DUF262 domain-containing protein [Nocardia cyriacigeorgica]